MLTFSEIDAERGITEGEVDGPCKPDRVVGSAGGRLGRHRSTADPRKDKRDDGHHRPRGSCGWEQDRLATPTAYALNLAEGIDSD